MSKSVSELASVTPAGTDLLLVSRLSATVAYTATTISAAASDNSLNDSASQFVAEGFVVGQRIKIAGFTGTPGNNVDSAVVTSVAAGKIIVSGVTFVDDAAGESVTITAWESHSVEVGDLGGLGGSTGSTDNAILRADGTGGSTVQASGVQIGDADEIHGYLANINFQTGTSYTIDVAGPDTDAGKIIDHANAAAISVTLPATAPVGFACTYVQTGAGQITFASTGSGTLANRQSHTKTAGNKAMVTLYVRANSGGSAAAWVLGGDTAA